VASIYSLKEATKSGRVAIIKSLPAALEEAALGNSDSTSNKFSEFWDLMASIKQHGYMRAAMSVIGRSAVGTWFTLQRYEEYQGTATERQRRRLMDFYLSPNREWKNIKDFESIVYKVMIGFMYFRYFGQVAYQVLYNAAGEPVGLDHLPGLVVPNVDEKGNFKSPAFIQYPSSNPKNKVEFKNAKDIIYIFNPDWTGNPLGGTDIESLMSFTLPLDLYLQTGAREYMKNRDRPEVVYEVSPDISDEAFEEFVKGIETKHAGASNLGRSSITVQGEFKIHELSPMPDALPYEDSRETTRQEELAVAGVSGSKLGISKDSNNAGAQANRREFHETTMIPQFKFFEQALYEQAHVRLFNIRGWILRFNNPDFLTAVERATVHMRYKQMSAMNANEIRATINLQPRKDELGDMFEDQQAEKTEEEPDDEGTPNPQGNPPEGREPEPDDPSQTGEPTDDDQDPERGDQHDEETSEAMLRELRTWRSFAINRVKRGKQLRNFESVYIPEDVHAVVQEHLVLAKSVEDVSEVFDIVFEELRDDSPSQK